jgi:hypothetical protein
MLMPNLTIRIMKHNQQLPAAHQNKKLKKQAAAKPEIIST